MKNARCTLPAAVAAMLLASTGCQDRNSPGLLAPEGPSVSQVASNCVVTTTEDSGAGSLREAIANASCGEIGFALAYPATIALTTGELLIGRSVDINGPGADRLIIARDAVDYFRVIHVEAGATVTISGVTVTAGVSYGPGGAIRNSGTMTVANSVVTRNEGTQGGGIFNDGVFELVSSTLSDNDASYGGGFVNRGVARLIGSTIFGNTAWDDPGGGVFNGANGEMTIINSTISGNQAPWDPSGGIQNYSSMVLQHSTVTGNRGRWGGGIGSGPNLLIENSIVAGNTAEQGAPDIGATQLTARYSLIGTAESYTLADGSGNNVIAPQAVGLAALADNGGATRTHRLLPSSPAVNAGDPAFTSTTLLYDQRGQGFARVSGGRTDMGAFELQQTPPTPADLLEELITASAGTPGVSRGTQNKLLDARNHLSAGRTTPACNKLREYIADVQSQSGKRINSVDAARLIGMAREVRAAIGC
ncbi:MAG: right-handed parallel beta-helix repeat-containing protein [Gemmatimonadetes bacterium]|nr:right-handed parallel beta-helix repeat-containing protein [Gemmatimonadota bacterium]